LRITQRLEVGADRDSDEIALQCVVCAACGFRGVAVYEESRRGSLDSEVWDHTGYRVAPAAWDALAGQLAACPQPNTESCPCVAHQSLPVYDE
jgi:hypothetical protein